MSKDKDKFNDKQKNLRKDLPIVAHEFSLEELAAKYNVSFERGLTSAQVEDSRNKHGQNRLTPPKVKPAWLLYVEQFTDFFSLLLIAGGVLCFIAYGIDQSDASNLYLGTALLLVVFISSTFAYFQEAKSQAIMEGFKSLIPKKCKVVRDGAPNVLDAVELVPGDLVEFQEGDQVPADVRVIDSYNLKVDNSALTGESEACERGSHLHVTNHAGDIETGQGGKPPARKALVFCISIIVAVVPEGLLVTLTVALALTAKRMHNKNVLVKNLLSVETLGCTTVIASDKTGTLTQNRMTVQHCWYDDNLYDVPAARNAP
ncbi:hypothetical protein GPECTOR_353g109 [Gonium pectorale]|uniref:Cation-transporting P-type ATPase N-terminal domain-containing protein n=1 Tax=Gonium pectorale TaxID=33097 RepID=A0A150FX68_GONPE|nr:hypothetical protein GPECTOR_353g109 [Gonium pectorale]|eukprot:KXZ41630.1 hypothetical protein GPECTOR_353g109 [Gonium pectorale]